jgi:hypothetical protein
MTDLIFVTVAALAVGFAAGCAMTTWFVWRVLVDSSKPIEEGQ